MKTVCSILIVSAVPILMLCVGLRAGDAPPVNFNSNMEGSYALDYRELPDGKKLHAPDVFGMLTFTKDRRNFNVYWTENGKRCSLSMISAYTLSDKEYTEDNIYMADNASGNGVKYDVTPSHGKSTVTARDGKIEFIFPLHSEPQVAFDSNGFTATRKGVFVDHWKKIN